MGIRILEVTPSSPADRAGIRAGETLLSINDEAVLDEIDYQALTTSGHLAVTVQDTEGTARQVEIRKPRWEPLGLSLDETQAMKPRHCRNHCLFCFIDQLPRGMRDTLYVKDDDWRLSLMMGNYVTLTNVDDAEFERMLRRRASPVYISVHATDPEVRVRLLRNPHAGNIMERLIRMKEAGIRFHGQIVLCPGINDGAVLEKTIEDFASLWPASQSLAIVPIGMTCHREKLVKMQPVDPDKALEVIRTAEKYQERFLKEFGTRFVFPSDEFYCICEHELPSGDDYEDYPQIENGVGMLRQLEEECEAAAEETAPESGAANPDGKEIRVLIPTGTSARPFIERLAERYAPPGVKTEVIAVKNRFFGESITVTGLIVGRDLIDAVKGHEFDRVLISETMLRENTDSFLDDTTLEEVRRAIGKPVIVVGNTGDAFIRALRETEEENE
ncbi:MAG: DUF512 domain-containing protein [Clostridiales bacterium]|nr:DUF512 domain-containing protein [Clostridiales bacterium]